MKNPDAVLCWEVMDGRTLLLTVHRCTRPRVVTLAQREAFAQRSPAGQVKLRQVTHCVCRSINGPQPQTGAAAVIVAPSRAWPGSGDPGDPMGPGPVPHPVPKLPGDTGGS